MVILTVFLFVVGAVTLMVFYRQLGEMKTQTGILNTQAPQPVSPRYNYSLPAEAQPYSS